MAITIGESGVLLVVDVHGAAFYVAWGLIVLALAGEAVGTLMYWTQWRQD